MKLIIEITFQCSGEREARALTATLAPDNRGLPAGQRLRVERRGRTLHFTIESPRIASGVASASSLLSDAKLFHDVWTIAS